MLPFPKENVTKTGVWTEAACPEGGQLHQGQRDRKPPTPNLLGDENVELDGGIPCVATGLEKVSFHSNPKERQAGFRKGRGTRDQIANILWIIGKAREFQKKKIYFCFIDYAKVFDCVGHNKLWKILKDMGISDHLTCLLRNLYAGQETAVITGHGTAER